MLNYAFGGKQQPQKHLGGTQTKWRTTRYKTKTSTGGRVLVLEDEAYFLLSLICGCSWSRFKVLQIFHRRGNDLTALNGVVFALFTYGILFEWEYSQPRI